jgi:peptidyl-prolyl cis-trans isomerase C
VVFKEKVGGVHGPVKTQFGYHLIEIVERSE